MVEYFFVHRFGNGLQYFKSPLIFNETKLYLLMTCFINSLSIFLNNYITPKYIKYIVIYGHP